MEDDRLSKLEAEVAELRAAIYRRAEQRDGQLSAVAADLAAADKTFTAIRADIDRIEEAANRPTPGILTILGVGITFAGLLASGFTFVLNERVDPIKADVAAAKQSIQTLSGLYGALARDNATQDATLAWHKEWVSSLQDAGTRLNHELTETRIEEARK